MPRPVNFPGVGRLIFLIIFASSMCNSVRAGDTAAPQSAPQYRLSFSERARIETWDNTIGLEKNAAAGNSCTRNRTSLMLQWFPHARFEATIKMTDEFRYYFVPESKPFTFDEIFVDQLYVKLNRLFDSTVTLTLGRQNMSFGEGFVIMDGGPLDGSRSGYFNAARLDYSPAPTATFTMFYFYEQERDKILPRINDQRKPMNDQPEEAFGVYFTGDFGRVNVQSYIIRKITKKLDSDPSKNKYDVNTMGARVVAPLVSKLTLTAEGACQFDRDAIGGYAYLSYQTGWRKYFPQVLTAGSLYLSGDDLKTGKTGGWDPLYGRWPKWSDSYIYTLKDEAGVAYWTNLFSLYAKMQFDINKDVKFTFDYHHLMAPEKPADREGRRRGELCIGKLSYQINKNISGHILWENFNPGTYYSPEADNYNWMRIEFMLNI